MTRRGRPTKPEPDKTWFVAQTQMPLAPDELTGSARSEWQRLKPYLESLLRVTRLDRLPLAEYCLAWGRFHDLMDRHFAKDTDDLDADGPSSRVAHPLLAPMLDAARIVLKYGEEWGLTARSRDLDGASKIPSEIKRLFGNRRKVAETKIPDSIMPLLPSWQDEEMALPLWANDRVRRLYNEVGTELQNLDLFTPLDRVQLIVLCCLHDIILRAHEQLTNELVEVLSAQGEVKYERANPLYEVITKFTVVVRQYYSAYGMTAKARRLLPSEEKVEAKRPIIFKGKFG
jgi:P27 family predicted phage terminase small subunit